MVFNSLVFLVFFITFFIIYWSLNKFKSVTPRNFFILVASYFFYGWWDWRFLILIFISSLIDFSLGLWIQKSEAHKRKALLIISVAINLGILAFFKYFNFFIDSFQSLISIFSITLQTRTLQIILPVGISFYTFQSLSYTIDIYRKKLEPTKNILTFFTFVSFFPQLVAGPIERATQLLDQFNHKKIFNYSIGVIGLRWIIWGLFKKMVIADNLGLITDSIFNPQNNLSTAATLLGAFTFAFQIYCDFSGYSDMAKGIAKLLGFELMQNFRTPYFASSFSSFWHRWHISLSQWFRDYVYIPLGGNVGSSLKVASNIFITFLLSGFWHGAQITFLIWGALHGLLLILEKLFSYKIKKWLATPIVFITVTLLWLPFRANDFGQFKQMIFSLLQFDFIFISEPILKVVSFTKLMTIGTTFIIFITFERGIGLNDFNYWIGRKNTTQRVAIYYFLLVSILLLSNFDIKPNFIYFQF